MSGLSWMPAKKSILGYQVSDTRATGPCILDKVLEVWKAWSEGIDNYVSTNEDQYSPFRIGSSYPLVFRRGVQIPAVPYIMFGGNRICNPAYTAQDNEQSSLFQYGLPVEIERLGKMREYFRTGTKILESIYTSLPKKK